MALFRYPALFWWPLLATACSSPRGVVFSNCWEFERNMCNRNGILVIAMVYLYYCNVQLKKKRTAGGSLNNTLAGGPTSPTESAWAERSVSLVGSVSALRRLLSLQSGTEEEFLLSSFRSWRHTTALMPSAPFSELLLYPDSSAALQRYSSCTVQPELNNTFGSGTPKERPGLNKANIGIAPPVHCSMHYIMLQGLNGLL